MARIPKEVMKHIEARYIDVGDRQHWHKYNAAARIRIVVPTKNTWDLYISPSRVGRPIDEAVKAILRETKVGKKILKKAQKLAADIKETGKQMDKDLAARREAAKKEKA